MGDWYRKFVELPSVNKGFLTLFVFVLLPGYLIISIAGWMGPGYRVAGIILAALVALIVGLIAIVHWISGSSARRAQRVRIDEPEFREWLRGQAKVLHELGFYAEHGTADELYEELLNLLEQEVGKDVGEYRECPPMLALWDDARVWHGVFESDEYLNEDGYQELMEKWSAISRGTFIPSNIVIEVSEEDGEGVKIAFDFDGIRRLLSINFQGDWLDYSLIRQVEELFEDREFQFVQAAPCDFVAGDAVIMMFLRASEKERLQQEAGWEF